MLLTECKKCEVSTYDGNRQEWLARTFVLSVEKGVRREFPSWRVRF